ncbi:MAG TPA: hypothetical protein VHY56_10490 [Candidatus Binataceae bacterium]|nr:hypothetical protein [Candidatus Binataceae bacterium]
MNLKAMLRKWSDPVVGDIDWDSESSRLDGALAPSIRRFVDEARATGHVAWGPHGCLDHPITDPLRTPAEFALILDVMGFVLPPGLAEAYPEPPAELLQDPEYQAMTLSQRGKTVF